MRLFRLVVLALLVLTATVVHALPQRTKLTAKYRNPKAKGFSTYGEQGILKVTLKGTHHVEFLRGVVRDAKLPDNGYDQSTKIVVSQFFGHTRMTVRGLNTDVRRVEAIIRSHTNGDSYSDKVVDRDPALSGK